jgi:hypothetical protein
MHGKQIFYLLAETHEGKSLHTQPWKSKKLETTGKITHKISQTFKNYVYHQSHLDIKSLQYLFRGPLEGVGILGVTFIKLSATTATDSLYGSGQIIKHKNHSHSEQFSFSRVNLFPSRLDHHALLHLKPTIFLLCDVMSSSCFAHAHSTRYETCDAINAQLRT